MGKGVKEVTDREILELLLRKASGLETGQQEMKEYLQLLQGRVVELGDGAVKLNRDVDALTAKVDVIHGQTTRLTEDVAELKPHIYERIESKLDEISRDIGFLQHKEITNEKEIFNLKRERQA